MKKLFFVIATLLSITIIKAQQQLTYLPVKQGIYLTFRSIRNNQPLPDTGFTITERSAVNTAGGKYKLESDSLAGNGLREFKSQYIGFSDGKDFYISDRFTTGGELGLTKCTLTGRYIFAAVNDVGVNGQPLVYSYVIDINKGLSFGLSKEVMKNILEQYPDLEKKYRKEDLVKDAQEILQKVNAKQLPGNDDSN